jgi:hypothetical protein
VEKSKTTLPELTCADIAQSNSRITQPHHFDVKGRTVFTNIGGMTLANHCRIVLSAFWIFAVLADGDRFIVL